VISPQFWDFISSISVKIDDMGEHHGYKGDVHKGSANYLNWKPICTPERQIECVFHVGPTMNEEEHRRLIGMRCFTLVRYAMQFSLV
jgi:hypothetical protein